MEDLTKNKEQHLRLEYELADAALKMECIGFAKIVDMNTIINSKDILKFIDVLYTRRNEFVIANTNYQNFIKDCDKRSK